MVSIDFTCSYFSIDSHRLKKSNESLNSNNNNNNNNKKLKLGNKETTLACVQLADVLQEDVDCWWLLACTMLSTSSY